MPDGCAVSCLICQDVPSQSAFLSMDAQDFRLTVYWIRMLESFFFFKSRQPWGIECWTLEMKWWNAISSWKSFFKLLSGMNFHSWLVLSSQTHRVGSTPQSLSWENIQRDCLTTQFLTSSSTQSLSLPLRTLSSHARQHNVGQRTVALEGTAWFGSQLSHLLVECLCYC